MISVEMKTYFSLTLLYSVFAAFFSIAPSQVIAPVSLYESSNEFAVSDTLFILHLRHRQFKQERAELKDLLSEAKTALNCETEKIADLRKASPKIARAIERQKEIWIFTPTATNPFNRPKLEPFEPLDTNRRGRVVLTSKGN